MFEKQGIPVTVPGNVTYIMIHHVRIKIDFIRFSCSFTATALHRAGRRRPAMIRDLTPAVSRQLQHAAAAARWSCVVTDTPVQHVVNFELSSPLCVTVISDRCGVAWASALYTWTKHISQDKIRHKLNYISTTKKNCVLFKGYINYLVRVLQS